MGLDWADQSHEIRLQAVGSDVAESFKVEQKPEALHAWMARLRTRFPQGRVALALEQSRGAVIYALMSYDFLLLYPVPPKGLARYREAFATSGAKSDPTDAGLLLELVRTHRDRLRAWQPDDVLTRQLRLLVEHRRRTVADRTRLTNRLTALLKTYFPQALDWAGDLRSPAACQFLLTWPTLEGLQGASRSQLRRFYHDHRRLSAEDLKQLFQQIDHAQPLSRDRALVEASALMTQTLAAQLEAAIAALEKLDQALAELFAQHPDQDLFSSLPGAGEALAPRLAAAFGSDRHRFQSAEELQRFSGIAPITEASGKMHQVHWRMACPKFLRQTFHEFAAASTHRSLWARAYYDRQRQRGASHHAAVRALAYKWIRILYRCWQTHTPYDEKQYLEALRRRRSPLWLTAAIPEARS
ncbi:MAG TPA: IS110 family transposase [Terriglobia bacterium]|nr:IS110 family transposase [Terriglobia bacterium]